MIPCLLGFGMISIAVVALPVLLTRKVALVTGFLHDLKTLESGLCLIPVDSAHMVEPGGNLALLLDQLVQVL